MTQKLSFRELLAQKKASLSAKLDEPLEIDSLPNVGEPITFEERMAKEPIPHETVEDLPPASKPMTFAERLAAAKAGATTRPATAPIEEPVEEPTALPKVVISQDVINLSNQTALSESAAGAIEETSSVEEIKERIARLATLSDLDLKLAMDSLKALILANPSACTQLLPEDVGDMVTALRSMTANSKAEIMAAPRRRTAAPKATALNPDELDALVGDLL